MQKIKNEKGVTLVALVITVIVSIIIASIGINIGLDSVNSTKDRNLQAELEIVGQAAITEYTKAVELDYLNDTPYPSNFVGTVVSVSALPIRPSGESWALSTEDATTYKSYFRLTPNDLQKLDIANSEHTYIVNYYTGEVFNETKQKASNGADLYIKMDKATHETETTSDFSGT